MKQHPPYRSPARHPPTHERLHPVVHVVDDDPMFLRAVALLLRSAGFRVETFSSAEAFLDRSGDSPGCAVVDLRMPGYDGLELQQAIAATEEPLPVVFLTASGDISASVRAMKHGAVDFLVKPVSSDDLIAAVQRAIAVDETGRAGRRQRREVRARYLALTPRERQVFALVVEGRLNKQIAGELGTSERTIKAHRAGIMRKMEAGSVADLVRAAERLDGTAGGSRPA